MYQIEISPSAEKDLKKLNKKSLSLNDIIDSINSLSIDPRPVGVRKITGFRNTFRIRVGSYRVIYDVYEKDNIGNHFKNFKKR